jgi:hypothetical protein
MVECTLQTDDVPKLGPIRNIGYSIDEFCDQAPATAAQEAAAAASRPATPAM